MKRIWLGACPVLLAGCEVHFGHPNLLWLLWLVPSLAALLIFWGQRAAVALQRFVAQPARLGAPPVAAVVSLKAGLLLFALLMIVLALAQPRWGYVWEDVKREGVDIVIALDVSDSMLVQDVQVKSRLSRLEQAKREIIDLLKILDGDRVALVAFAGAAFVECPLTLDYSAAALFLDDLDTDLISVKGTALGAGIRTAVGAMAGAEHTSQAVILITDGEDHSGEAAAAANEAAEAHIRIFPIGIGRDEGAPIPMSDGGFHRDAQGNLVLSKLDENTLQNIAKVTGGLYTRSLAGEMDLESLYKRGIRAMLRPQQQKGKRRQRFEERFVYFVGLAALALMLEALLPNQPRARTPQ